MGGLVFQTSLKKAGRLRKALSRCLKVSEFSELFLPLRLLLPLLEEPDNIAMKIVKDELNRSGFYSDYSFWELSFCNCYFLRRAIYNNVNRANKVSPEIFKLTV
jgi:hypothetical protein